MASTTMRKNNVYEFKKHKLKYKKKKAQFEKNNPKPPKKIKFTKAAIISMAVLGALIVIFIIWALTNKNAQMISIGDTQIGAVKGLKLNARELQELAIEKLKVDIGANVSVNEMVTLTPIHAKKRELYDYNYVVSEIVKSFTYTIESSVLVMDGIEIVTMKTREELDNLLEDIINQYRQQDKNIVEASIIDDFEISSKFVSTDEIMSRDKAYNILTAQKDAYESYTVVPGDSLWAIANRAGITIDKLIDINDGMTEDSVLKIGQTLKLVIPKPVLSVKTVEETTANILKRKSEEFVENPAMPKTYRRSIQQGKDGQATIVMHTTRINGLEVSQEQIREEITVPPVNDIIEIGTKS